MPVFAEATQCHRTGGEQGKEEELYLEAFLFSLLPVKLYIRIVTYSHSKVEYRCQEAKGAGFSLQCSDGDPWWGACHPVGWPTCNLSSDAFAHLPTFKAPLESDFVSSPLPPSISSQYASVDPALLILASEGPISLTTPTPDCSPPPPPPLEDFLIIGASLNLVDKHLLVACGGSKCFSWDMEHPGRWQFFSDTRFLKFTSYLLWLDTSAFIVRERREGHGAAAMKDSSGNLLLLGGYLSQFTAEIVPSKHLKKNKQKTEHESQTSL